MYLLLKCEADSARKIEGAEKKWRKKSQITLMMTKIVYECDVVVLIRCTYTGMGVLSISL